jgi:hypothetical protein
VVQPPTPKGLEPPRERKDGQGRRWLDVPRYLADGTPHRTVGVLAEEAVPGSWWREAWSIFEGGEVATGYYLWRLYADPDDPARLWYQADP